LKNSYDKDIRLKTSAINNLSPDKERIKGSTILALLNLYFILCEEKGRQVYLADTITSIQDGEIRNAL